jgi:peptidoglycan/xylan/chitin deacetylase (PgdA/CDA1 family)
VQILNSARNFVTRAIPVKLIKSKLRRPVASFTFDDFPKSAWTVGGEILRRYNARGTYYVAGSLCGKVEKNIQYYDRYDLLALAEAGHEVGCHSFAHRRASQLTSMEIRSDAEQNADFLRKVLGDIHLASFAYPYGDVDPRTKFLYGRLFPSSRGVRWGINTHFLDLALLRVARLYEIERLPQLLDEVILQARESLSWLIFLTHDVQPNPGPYGCSPDTLNRAMRKVSDLSIQILSVKHALALATIGETE